MLKIIGLALAAFMFMGLVGGGSWAFYQDMEFSAGNELVAGTLDLKTDDADGVTQTIRATRMKRGDTASGNITLQNVGSADAATIDIDVSFAESDDPGNLVNMSNNATASVLEVTTLNYDGVSRLALVNDENSNGYKDVYDLSIADMTGLDGILALSDKLFEITVRLRSDTHNDFQGDGIELRITFLLNQIE